MRKLVITGLALFVVVTLTLVSCGKSNDQGSGGTTFFPQVSL